MANKVEANATRNKQRHGRILCREVPSLFSQLEPCIHWSVRFSTTTIDYHSVVLVRHPISGAVVVWARLLRPRVLFYVGMFAWGLYDLVDLKINNAHLLEGSETSWGFGQILAVVLILVLIFELLDAVKSKYRRSISVTDIC